MDKKFLALAVVLGAATVYDVESTFHAFAADSGGREGNPLLRPFMKMGRPGGYGICVALDVGATYYAYREKRRGLRAWWVPSAVHALIHATAGTHNVLWSR
jgi:hypothetical protein